MLWLTVIIVICSPYNLIGSITGRGGIKESLIPVCAEVDSRDSQADESVDQWRPAFGGRDDGIGDRFAGYFYGSALRRLARGSKSANQARRLLALAEIYDGGGRTAATRIGGVGLQIVRDWVMRFNARGPDGLLDGKALGPRSQPSRPRAVRAAQNLLAEDTRFARSQAMWQEHERNRFADAAVAALEARAGNAWTLTPHGVRLLKRIYEGFDAERVDGRIPLTGRTLDQCDADEIFALRRSAVFAAREAAARRGDPRLLELVTNLLLPSFRASGVPVGP